MALAPSTASSPTSRQPGRPPGSKGELTAERILDAAEVLFAEKGYAGTTLRDVAASVGIRIPSLYNHFPSKDSLYVAVLERVTGPVVELLSGLVAPPPESDDRDTQRVIEEIMDLLSKQPTLPRLLQHETLTGGQRLTPMLRTAFAPIFSKASEVVAAREDTGRWQPEQIPLLVLALYHIVAGYFAVAPLYQNLNGVDLMTPEARALQTRFVAQVADALFSKAP